MFYKCSHLEWVQVLTTQVHGLEDDPAVGTGIASINGQGMGSQVFQGRVFEFGLTCHDQVIVDDLVSGYIVHAIPVPTHCPVRLELPIVARHAYIIAGNRKTRRNEIVIDISQCVIDELPFGNQTR